MIPEPPEDETLVGLLALFLGFYGMMLLFGAANDQSLATLLIAVALLLVAWGLMSIHVRLTNNE